MIKVLETQITVWPKNLLYKYEDKNLDPQQPWKCLAGHSNPSVIPVLEGREKETLGQAARDTCYTNSLWVRLRGQPYFKA